MESTTSEQRSEIRGIASDSAKAGSVTEFMEERKYLKNVTSKTLAWYQHSFKAFDGALESEASIKQRIVTLRERGISAVSGNTWLRSINAYFRWRGLDLKIPRLKEEQKILATLNPEQVKRLISFKPRGKNQTRAHTVALLILDGGYRISEVLGLAFENCDFDNLVAQVKGKGNKHRLVPLSMEMRRVLYRYAAKHSGPGRLLFGTRNNTQVTVRNFERDFSYWERNSVSPEFDSHRIPSVTPLRSATSEQAEICFTCPKSSATAA